MIHHKNLTYFLNNAKKAKLQATREIGAGEKVSIIAKTTVVDIGTTAELGFGKEDYLMYLECMAQSYFGCHQQCWYFVIQVLINHHHLCGQCYGMSVQF